MSDLESRLGGCFSAVFPSVSGAELQSLTADSGDWDSLAGVTLAAVIQEEFQIEIDPEKLPDLTSFEAFRGYLAGR